MTSVWQDIRFATRTCTKQPGFTIVAILTLAIGIGANSAIFSVINGVLLKPLALTDPEKVVRLWETMPQGFQGSVSYPNLRDWREQNHVFSQIAAYQFQNLSLQSTDQPERVRAATVSPEFFFVMGVQPLMGRVISEGEDQPGKNRVAVLSEHLWKSNFGSDGGIINQTILLGGESYTVLGVMPGSFRFPSRNIDLWVPLTISQSQSQARGSHFLLTLARLNNGVTIQQAQEEMNLIARDIEEKNPDSQTGRGVGVNLLQDEMVRNVRPALLVLLVAVGFVLLIACTNVANLLLARAASRRREIAIRLALGAGRIRLIRQLLTESALLSLLGGALGLLISYFCVDVFVNLASSILPRSNEVTLDSKVVLFTIILSTFTGILFGLVPAFQSTRADLQTDLKEGGASAGSPSRSFTRSLLVVAEVAAALVLLIGASLLIKSFIRLNQTETGFQTDNVLTMGISLPLSKYSNGEMISAFYDQALERIMSLPGVESSGLNTYLPLQQSGYNGGIQIEGQPAPPPGRTDFVEFRAVSPHYFKTLGIPLIAGRGVDHTDRANTTPVVVVNQSFVNRYLPDENPIGKFVIRSNNSRYQIVGVVGDVKQSSLTQPARAEMYWHYAQVPDNGLRSSMSLVIRSMSDPTSLTPAIRSAILSVDPSQPVHNVMTMTSVVEDSVADRRLNMLLLSLFAGIALTLSLIGVYSVMSYLVAQNTRELGIRIALGATGSDILQLVLGKGAIFATIGVGIGILGAFALTRLMTSLLYGVNAIDPLIFITAPAVLTFIGLLASYIPARRALKVNPIIALRSE